MNIEGFTKNAIKAIIDDTLYIKVSNILGGDLLQGKTIINTVLYRKDENGYEAVTPLDVPIEHRNKLSYSKTYSLMNEDEIKEFLSAIKDSILKIKNNNKLIEYDELIIGNACDIYYAMTRTGNYRSLSGIKVNSNGEIKEQIVISPNELPYIVIDILNNYPELKNITMVVTTNVFVHVHKSEKGVIIYTGYISENENFSTGKVGEEQVNQAVIKINGSYTLALNENNYTFINDKESEVLLSFTEEEKSLILDELKENIEKM